MTKVIVTSNENETMAAGGELAKEILRIQSDRSIIVFLEGELGAGKTTFTKGILKGFDYQELVKSPTYNLVEIHETKNYKVFHFDLYRISEPIELEEIGIDEYLKEPRSVSIFEWPKNVEAALPSPDFYVQISYKDTNHNKKRELSIS
ncbi:MAG: tRNA (adenosine(37)-N6)-threonylcarbamoyltransferase complex ATPase subunit type 1 TsaE [Gammaproteobacteria bacterium]|tara:strand:+ start:347 stop:790 length:444 start_codon:yes stop_codon:yes gene_type:complete